ncbi:hypothetical protein LXA43DRAFT_389151 [Ganoderma leucocontextum]|nr:hypothetical protein LXA43DRAFT_389151 [Ganoderma leucocontextum]
MPYTPLPRTAAQLAAARLSDQDKAVYRSFILVAARVARNDLERIYSCILGYIFLLWPRPEAREAIRRELLAGRRPQIVYRLGAMYWRNLIRVFGREAGPHSPTLPHPSDSAFDQRMVEIMNELRSSPDDNKISKGKSLERERYRCFGTDRRDYRSAMVNLVETKRGDSRAVFTECSHIFPRSLGRIQEGGNGLKEQHVAAFWTTLERLGHGEIRGELAGRYIHRLENVVTLDTHVHDGF